MAKLLKPSRVRALPLMVFFSDASKEKCIAEEDHEREGLPQRFLTIHQNENASLETAMSGRARPQRSLTLHQNEMHCWRRPWVGGFELEIA